jgi:two-component sensor histidine kinase
MAIVVALAVAGTLIAVVLYRRAVAAQRRAEEELRTATERLQLAQEAGRVGTWEYVPGHDVVRWSPPSNIQYELTPGVPPSLATFRARVHADDRPLLDRTRAAEAVAAHESAFGIELRLPRANGEIRWFERRSRVLVEHGQRRVVGTNIDITDRKRAQEHQRLLINELNHRVKNTLATVQAVAMQTFRNAGVAGPVADAFQSRLMALSAAHDVLTRENWSGADLRDIVAEAVAPHCAAGPERVRIDGPSVRLPAKSSLAIAMGLHELCTNASKYGALGAAGGEVLLGWQVMDQSDGARLRLRWEERGGPRVERPSRRGFGSRLVTDLLAAELDAEITLDYPPGGVVCTIDAPLPDPREGLRLDADAPGQPPP